MLMRRKTLEVNYGDLEHLLYNTMQEFVRDFVKQSKADNEQIMQDAVTRILATIISAMGQQAGGYVAVPAMMQGMNEYAVLQK